MSFKMVYATHTTLLPCQNYLKVKWHRGKEMFKSQKAKFIGQSHFNFCVYLLLVFNAVNIVNWFPCAFDILPKSKIIRCSICGVLIRDILTYKEQN